MLLSTFGTIAVLLAAVGIFGVMAYLVSQSTREIGLRMALGARKSAVLKLVLGRASVLVAIGLIVGVVGATGAARVLQSVVFGLTALEPATLAGVVALFAVVALVAAYVLARRATRVDPVVALRGE